MQEKLPGCNADRIYRHGRLVEDRISPSIRKIRYLWWKEVGYHAAGCPWTAFDICKFHDSPMERSHFKVPHCVTISVKSIENRGYHAFDRTLNDEFFNRRREQLGDRLTACQNLLPDTDYLHIVGSELSGEWVIRLRIHSANGLITCDIEVQNL